MPRQKVYASDADRIQAFRERRRAAEQEAERVRREAEYQDSKREQRIRREVDLFIAEVLENAGGMMPIGKDLDTASDERERLAIFEQYIRRFKAHY